MSRRESRVRARLERSGAEQPTPPPDLAERVKGEIPKELFPLQRPPGDGRSDDRTSSGARLLNWQIAAGVLAAILVGVFALRMGHEEPETAPMAEQSAESSSAESLKAEFESAAEPPEPEQDVTAQAGRSEIEGLTRQDSVVADSAVEDSALGNSASSDKDRDESLFADARLEEAVVSESPAAPARSAREARLALTEGALPEAAAAELQKKSEKTKLAGRGDLEQQVETLFSQPGEADAARQQSGPVQRTAVFRFECADPPEANRQLEWLKSQNLTVGLHNDETGALEARQHAAWTAESLLERARSLQSSGVGCALVTVTFEQ